MTIKTAWLKRRAHLQADATGRFFLLLLSLIYGAAVFARRMLYKFGLLKSRKLPAKVICIGNLTTGGTGKTPAVLLAAQTLRRRSIPVAILSRGYGRRGPGREVTALLEDTRLSWSECGDEPWMMHQALQGQNIPILISRDRLKAGQEAITFYHSKILILDDGFQHLKLKRDLNILLMNATDPFGGRHLLPLGNLREPLTALSRAHMIILTHVDRVEESELEAIKKEISSLNPRIPVLEAAHKADFLFDLKTEKKCRLSHLSGQKVVALSAIADPPSFETQIIKIGAEIGQKWRYPDHHPFSPRELASLEKLRRGMPLVTTFKDYTRFPKGWQDLLSGETFALAIKLDIVKGKNAWLDGIDHVAGKLGTQR